MNPASMRRLATALGVISLVTALSFAYLFIKRNAAQSQKNAPETIDVVETLDQPVLYRERISSTSGRFHVVRKSAAEVPASDTFRRLEEIDGLIAADTIQPHTVLLKSKTQSAANEFVGALRHGYEALTIAADKYSVIGGFLRPGDYVDVLASVEVGTGNLRTQMVLQNLRVLAVGTMSPMNSAPSAGQSGQAEQKAELDVSNVTLEVRPDQAARLWTAEQKGKLRLALRGLGGDRIALRTPPVVTANDMFPPAPAASTTATTPGHHAAGNQESTHPSGALANSHHGRGIPQPSPGRIVDHGPGVSQPKGTSVARPPLTKEIIIARPGHQEEKHTFTE